MPKSLSAHVVPGGVRYWHGPNRFIFHFRFVRDQRWTTEKWKLAFMFVFTLAKKHLWKNRSKCVFKHNMWVLFHWLTFVFIHSRAPPVPLAQPFLKVEGHASLHAWRFLCHLSPLPHASIEIDYVWFSQLNFVMWQVRQITTKYRLPINTKWNNLSLLRWIRLYCFGAAWKPQCTILGLFHILFGLVWAVINSVKT